MCIRDREIHLVLHAPVDLPYPFLPTKPLDFGDRHAFDTDGVEGFLYRLQLEGLDNRLDLFHVLSPLLQTVPGFLMFGDIQTSHFIFWCYPEAHGSVKDFKEDVAHDKREGHGHHPVSYTHLTLP